MVVSSQTLVWNHRQLLHDMLLYGGTFYILLSGAGKINAKSQLSPSHFAALKHRPLSGSSTASAESPYEHVAREVFVRLFVHVDNNSLAAELLQKMGHIHLYFSWISSFFALKPRGHWINTTI